VLVIAEHHRANRVALQVQRERECIVRQLDHLALHRIGQAVHAHDAVGDRGDGAFVARVGGQLDLLDAVPDQFADFGRVEL